MDIIAFCIQHKQTSIQLAPLLHPKKNSLWNNVPIDNLNATIHIYCVVLCVDHTQPATDLQDVCPLTFLINMIQI